MLQGTENKNSLQQTLECILGKFFDISLHHSDESELAAFLEHNSFEGINLNAKIYGESLFSLLMIMAKCNCETAVNIILELCIAKCLPTIDWNANIKIEPYTGLTPLLILFDSLIETDENINANWSLMVMKYLIAQVPLSHLDFTVVFNNKTALEWLVISGHFNHVVSEILSSYNPQILHAYHHNGQPAQFGLNQMEDNDCDGLEDKLSSLRFGS